MVVQLEQHEMKINFMWVPTPAQDSHSSRKLTLHMLASFCSQNRFYDATRYDLEIRKYCRENGIVYQSFWTLTASE